VVNPASRRRRLLWWSAVPVLLVLCLAAKLLSLGILGGRAASGFAAGDAAGVQAAAGGLSVANVVEPHKAAFAAGDGAVMSGDDAAARALFEQALGTVPAGSGDECLIRVNLVLVIERLGDQRLQAGDPASAVALYREALASAGHAPESCLAADAAAGTGTRLAEARERLEAKLGVAGQSAQPAPAPGEKSPGDMSAGAALEDRLEQLQERSRQAERERNSGREREKYLDSNDGAAPERPW